jgi:hypothetical protein
VAGLALLIAMATACGSPPRPDAAGEPATSAVPPQLVPGATPPTRPPLSPAVAVSPVPPPAGSPIPTAAATPAPSPVMHPTLPRLDVTPSPAAPAKR